MLIFKDHYSQLINFFVSVTLIVVLFTFSTFCIINQFFRHCLWLRLHFIMCYIVEIKIEVWFNFFLILEKYLLWIFLQNMNFPRIYLWNSLQYYLRVFAAFISMNLPAYIPPEVIIHKGFSWEPIAAEKNVEFFLA